MAKMRKGRAAKKTKQPLRGEMRVEKEIGIAPKIPKVVYHATGKMRKQPSGMSSQKKMRPLLGLV